MGQIDIHKFYLKYGRLEETINKAKTTDKNKILSVSINPIAKRRVWDMQELLKLFIPLII